MSQVKSQNRDSVLVERLLFTFFNLIPNLKIKNLILHFTTTSSVFCSLNHVLLFQEDIAGTALSPQKAVN